MGTSGQWELSKYLLLPYVLTDEDQPRASPAFRHVIGGIWWNQSLSHWNHYFTSNHWDVPLAAY